MHDVDEPARAVPTEPGQVADLPEDRHIVIRQVRDDDQDALFDLYDQLDDDERWQRFRSLHRPPASFFEDLARPAASGGARLVAELTSPVGTQIIGEAGYVGLANGNGELAMLVGKRWRGWLGPLLLDDLLIEAAARGVPNLEADVATADTPMLALLHEHGAVVIGHDRWSLERLLVSTAGDVPTWTGFADRPRVLVEAPGARIEGEDDLQTLGYTVVSCHGPRRRRGCPALRGAPCELAASADVIIVRQPPDDEAWRALLAAHARVHPGVPVLVRSRPPRHVSDPSDPGLVADVQRVAMCVTPP